MPIPWEPSHENRLREYRGTKDVALMDTTGETILVVDDEPVSLKLAAAALRSEGYHVHLSSTGEQALTALKTVRPDLTLVDIRLPGIDGLELTRRIRQDPRARDTLVVALTACTSGEDENRAYDAGCDGFIRKPINTRALGNRVRAFLHGKGEELQLPADGSFERPELGLDGPEMADLRRSFLMDGARQTRRLLEFVGSRIDTAAAAGLMHQWIGAAGALGYTEIAVKAREVEGLYLAQGRDTALLRDTLPALLLAFQSPKEAAETPIPESILEKLAGKRIAMVGFADAEAEKVCAGFARARALPLAFECSEPRDSRAIRGCAAVLVHARAETADSHWLRYVPAPFMERPPLVLVGSREHLLALTPEVQAHAGEYLIDGWQPEELLMRMSFAIGRAVMSPAERAANQPVPLADRNRDGEPEVVIADDEVHVRAVVNGALLSMGINCRSTSNGPEALQMIRDGHPRAAVLDVNMPGMDGFEILSSIRKEQLPVRVVMLTARRRESDVLRGFELGADDYILKPFNPLELGARLKRLM